jgi:leader peptidase (prepilin peptidase) / N-methyltransferase
MAIIVFLFGLIIGSFLNVVIYRYNTGYSLGGRSKCGSCSYQLTWIDLVPVVSYLMLRGRCRQCGAQISMQYPVVELLTGLLFAGAYVMHGISTLFILDIIIFSILIVIFFYDLKHKIIPDLLVYLFIGLSLLRLAVLVSQSTYGLLMHDLMFGIIVAAFFFLLWLISQGRWIGLGDAKLVLGIGWFLGLVYGLSALLLAFWIGAIVGLALMFIGNNPGRFRAITSHWSFLGNISRKTEIPFAPFLILGLWIVYFFHFDLVGLNYFLGTM